MTTCHSDTRWLGMGAAAEYLGISYTKLKLLIMSGNGPKHYVPGKRVRKFKPADLDAWMDSRAVTPNEYQETT